MRTFSNRRSQWVSVSVLQGVRYEKNTYCEGELCSLITSSQTATKRGEMSKGTEIASIKMKPYGMQNYHDTPK